MEESWLFYMRGRVRDLGQGEAGASSEHCSARAGRMSRTWVWCALAATRGRARAHRELGGRGSRSFLHQPPAPCTCRGLHLLGLSLHSA